MLEIGGTAYDPMLVSCSGESKVEIPALKLADGLSPQRFEDRGALLRELDSLKRSVDAAAARDWDKLHQRAFALLSSEESYRAFDLSREPEKRRRSSCASENSGAHRASTRSAHATIGLGATARYGPAPGSSRAK